MPHQPQLQQLELTNWVTGHGLHILRGHHAALQPGIATPIFPRAECVYNICQGEVTGTRHATILKQVAFCKTLASD